MNIADHGVNNAQEGNGGDNGAAGETNDDSNEVCAAITFLNISIIIWTDKYSPKVNSLLPYALSLYNRCTPLLPFLTCVILSLNKQIKDSTSSTHH